MKIAHNGKESNDIIITANEPVAIQEHLSSEGQFPLKEELKHKRKTSVPEQSVETAFLVEKMSFDRGSPPVYVPEVIFKFFFYRKITYKSSSFDSL